MGRVANGGQGGREDLQRLVDFHLRAARHACPLQQRRQVVDVVRAENDIHPRGLGDDQIAVLLRQTAAHSDLEIRVGLCGRAQLADVAVEPIVGVLPHGAGVEHHDVRVGTGRGDIPCCLQHPGHAFGVVDIHLAADGAHLVATRARRRRPGYGWRRVRNRVRGSHGSAILRGPRTPLGCRV